MKVLSYLGSMLVLGVGAMALLAQPGCTECAALAVCDVGEREVTTCPTGKTCHEVTVCGNSILCEKNACTEPVCPKGLVKLSVCPPGDLCQTVTNDCGVTISCGPASCTSSAGCDADQFCAFPDEQCGRGQAGICKARPTVCSDGPSVCFCDGTITGPVGSPCAGLNGVDLDATGASCKLPPTAFSCGHMVCDLGTKDYCHITPSDTGGAPSAECLFAPCDPASCACLTAETQACHGTCADGPNGPTITCPGG